MKTRIKMLKVKIKSLAAEAGIIRREEQLALCRELPTEQRTKYRDLDLYGELRHHRRWDVRREQRVSLLAYAFLRGKPLSACEPKSKVEPDWARVLQLVLKFGFAGYESKAQAETRKLQAETQLKEWRAAATVAA